MTAHVGTKSVDGTPISQADLARIQAEERLHAEEQQRAVRVVASASLDVEDCRTLLSILGLDAKVAARPKPAVPPARAAKPARTRTARKPHAA